MVQRNGFVPTAGLMGSQRKIALVRKEFIASGLATPERFGQIFAPIGLDISAQTVPEIAASLSRAGRLEGAVMGELLGLPGERTGPLAQLADGPATYLATVIVPPGARRGQGQQP